MSNKHEDATFTNERLDIAVANLGWTQIFLEWWVEGLTTRCSDHKPIVLIHNDRASSEERPRKLFRYEVWWGTEVDCKIQVGHLWTLNYDNLSPRRSIHQLLSRCGQNLKS